ncbi:hypothetical protein V8E54_014047 [Elaphomyces granulatus]
MITSPGFFPNAELKFDVRILPGLHDGLPEPGSGTVVQALKFPPNPSYASIFKGLVTQFGSVITRNPKRARDSADSPENQPKSVRKHLPVSYRQATGYTPDGSGMFTTDNTYSFVKFVPREFAPSWGELIASILRIPDFAVAAGFIRTCTIELTTVELAAGAYIWLELDSGTAATIAVNDAAPMKTYAARIPLTSQSTDLFSPMLFPLLKPADLPVIPPDSFDQMFREAEDYADGWAKAVHCAQPQNTAVLSEDHNTSRPAKDLGIRLGWDDEQVTIWADRQIDPAKSAFNHFPLGTRGYRVDVRDVSSDHWFSLSTVKGDFGVTAPALGNITSELGVEVHPATPKDVVEDRSYWMPMYYANWTASSLVGMDEMSMKLLGRYNPPPNVKPPVFPHLGVVDPALRLRYGKRYQFRVRLMDLTGGGPNLDSATGTLGPSPTSSITFRRWIRPFAPQLLTVIPLLKDQPGAETPVDLIELKRPVIFYPAAMYTGYVYNGKDAVTELMSIADAINATPPPSRVTEPRVPDPDVNRIPLARDGPFMELYTTTRDLPADLKASAKVPLKWMDCANIWNPSEVNGFFLQPGLDATSRLAAALGLVSKDTSLRALAGTRVVFACSSSIMHVLGPDRASVTFASQSSLALQWLIVIRLKLERDWSWDGFPMDGIRVLRGDQDVVSFAPTHNANEDAFSRPIPERSSTDIVIIDVVDPQPPVGEKPSEKTLQYKIETNFLGPDSGTVAGPSMALSIDLPTTTPPTQIPQLTSAGLAMSPYIHDEGYSSTLARTKMLWLEFASPPDCRVLKYAPDPSLVGNFSREAAFESEEPPIPLDPEPVRRIVPGQTLDTAGLDAMQPLIPTSSPLHWGVPLPPGLTLDSLELLGFWTYEFRLGHWNDKFHTRWSTAQGRFGPALRITGVQHPPPQLHCSLNRDAKLIRVSARFAQLIVDGKPLFLAQPRTQIWFLLYAQAAQMDGSGQKRNILLARTQGRHGEGGRIESASLFERENIARDMNMYCMKHDTLLSVMAVEMLGQMDRVSDPLGGDLGRQRILRASCLVAVPGLC